MPRETQRRKSVRADADLSEGRSDVRIQEQRRFFSARGNDRALREARAIANAFNVGTQFVGDQFDRANVAGQERALEQAGAGGERDVNDKNAKYHRVWDRLDDEKSLNLAKKELPEILRGMDAENLPEEQVQAAITQYMEDQFAGIDLENEDHTFLAAGLLELETGLIADHRDGVIAKIKEGQITDTFEQAKIAYAETGVVPYDDIALRTNTFLDGSEKMTAYWEMIYDLAIEAGDPDIVRNTPKRFPGGDPTGIDDPRRADEHRAAINAATTKQASMAKARQDAEDARNDDLRFGTQMEIFRARQRGEDVSALIGQLASIPGTELSDISAAKNFGDIQLEERESRSADLSFTAPLWKQIHDGTGSIEQVWFAATEGFLGSGPQALDEMNAMMNAIESRRSSRERSSSAEVTAWRGMLNKRYNAQLGGLLTAVNPVMHRINLDANAMYQELTSSGMSGFEAMDRVIAKFDPMVDNLPDIEQDELTGRRSQSNFTVETTVTLDNFNRVLSGERSYNDMFAGVSPVILQSRLMDEVDAKNLTEAQAIKLIQLSQ